MAKVTQQDIEVRAQFGREAMIGHLAYVESTKHPQLVVWELLQNIMHYCDEDRVNFDEALAAARAGYQRYLEEVALQREQAGELIRLWIGTQPDPKDRRQILITLEDQGKRSKDEDIFVVTDHLTGERLTIRRGDCGAGCKCALELVDA
jgi:hypothetical protein